MTKGNSDNYQKAKVEIANHLSQVERKYDLNLSDILHILSEIQLEQVDYFADYAKKKRKR